MLALGTALVWSFSYIHIVWLAESANPVQMVIVRNWMVSPVVAALWIAVRPRVRGLSWKEWALVATIAFASGPVYHLPLHWGGSEGRTNASLIGLIIATIPVHIGWLAWVILRESLTWRRVLGFLFGLGGIFVVLGGRDIDLAPEHLEGPLAVTLAAVIAAFNVVLTRGARASFRPLELACLATTIAIVACLLATPFADMGALASMPFRGWWSAFYLGFFGIGVAYVLWFTALSGGLPAGSVAMYLFVPCVLSALWAWLWQDNQIGPAFFGGAGLVLVGLLVGASQRQPTPPAGPEPATAAE